MNIKASTVVANVLYSYAGLVIGTAIGFGLTPILIRHLGHGSYGVYILIGSMIGYTSLLDFGIGVTVMRLIAERIDDADRTETERLVANGVALYLTLGLLALAAGAILYPFLGEIFGVDGQLLTAFHLAFIITVASVTINFPSAVFTGVIQGHHDFRGANLLGLAQAAAGALAMLGVIELGGGIVAIAAATSLVGTVAFIGKAVYTRRKHRVGFRRSLVSRTVIRRLLALSAFLLVGNLASTIIFDLDPVIVGSVLGATAVTAFSVTVGATTAMQSLGDAMNSVTLNTASSLRARNDNEGERRLLLESVRMTAVLLLPFVTLAALWGGQLLRLWVGPSFVHSATTLWVLALGTTVALMQSAAAQVVIAHGRQRRLFYASVPEAAANLALSVVLARHLGIVGVAIGTTVPTAITTFAFVLPYACRLATASYWKMLRRLVPPVAVSGALWAVLDIHTFHIGYSNLGYLAAGALIVCIAGWTVALLWQADERSTYFRLLRRQGSSRYTAQHLASARRT